MPTAINLFKLAAVYRTLVNALYIDTLRDIREEVRKRERHVLKPHEHDN